MLPLDLPIEPMLARREDRLPRDRGRWSYEPKWDGFRCIVARDGEDLALWSRSRKPLTPYFPEIVEACRRTLPDQVVLDGELVVRTGPPGAQRLDWEAISLRIHPAARRAHDLARRTPAELVLFDLLALADLDLTILPQQQRRAALLSMFGASPHPSLHVTRATDDPDLAQTWFDRFEGAGLDGVVAKRVDDPYRPGARAMVKLKHARTAEAVVIGYALSRTGRGVGALHLGLWDDGDLIPVGGIGAFPDAVRSQLIEVLEPLVLTGAEAEAAPRPNEMSRQGYREFVPIRPDLVAEVAIEQMEGKRFRHTAQFLRWRPDRDPESCLLEQVERAPAYDLAAVFADGQDA